MILSKDNELVQLKLDIGESYGDSTLPDSLPIYREGCLNLNMKIGIRNKFFFSKLAKGQLYENKKF